MIDKDTAKKIFEIKMEDSLINIISYNAGWVTFRNDNGSAVILEVSTLKRGLAIVVPGDSTGVKRNPSALYNNLNP